MSSDNVTDVPDVPADWDDLQLKWDRFLVESFYERGHLPTQAVKVIFRSAHAPDISWEALSENLLRFPQHVWHSKVPFTRFVAAYLPTISKALFHYTRDDIERLVSAVNRLKSTTRREEVDKKEMNRLRSHSARSKDSYRRTKLERSGVRDWHDKFNLSNQWGVTK
jgi:hypothetical protein